MILELILDWIGVVKTRMSIDSKIQTSNRDRVVLAVATGSPSAATKRAGQAEPVCEQPRRVVQAAGNNPAAKKFTLKKVLRRARMTTVLSQDRIETSNSHL